MKKKILALCLIVALAATAAIGGTLAYFTDTAKAENVFTVGKLEIELAEPSWPGNTNVKHIVPGDDIPKDPTIIVKDGSVSCYVRAVITMPLPVYNASDCYNGISADNAKIQFVRQSTEWNVIEKEQISDDDVRIVLEYKEAVGGPCLLPSLFTSVKFSETLGNQDDDLYKLLDDDMDFNVDIQAYAVQSEHTGNASEAFVAAFPAVFTK